MSDLRKPTVFLNYSGDVADSFDMERPYGPNLMGELLYPLTTEYDKQSDRTRVGFSFVAPAEVTA